ncbi:unnamed protein product [Oikopleura dioica]|uniref:ABC transporter domain-containing protein n=1 Tax=Oikopleura dioica TaxID=34765 RepID=E4YAI8_OIKDI|nr:unnamed protein product [Oikopleura dioica]
MNLKKVDNRESPYKFNHLPKRHPCTIEFNQLSYFVPEGSIFHDKGFKTILKSVSGSFRAGELTAVMGPSGAGKSTLLNILAGYKELGTRGTVNINGKTRVPSKFRKQSCYIMQDDQLLPHLTVMEAMTVSAQLKLKKSQDKKELVNEIITSLGLYNARNTQTSALSGGQRKRLAICLELCNNPPVMFFDEPTSGLDSQTSFQVVQLMKSLAKGGRTIICTIHQPSARLFEMFDKLYILGSGQSIYNGTVKGLVPFLNSHNLRCPKFHNPADYVIEVASGEFGDVTDTLIASVKQGACEDFQTDEGIMKSAPDIYEQLVDSVLDSSPAEPVALEYSSSTSTDDDENFSFNTSSLTQFWILLKRSFLCIMRDQMLTQLRFISHVLIGLAIGVLYNDIGNNAYYTQQNVSMIFLVTLFLLFSALMPTVLTFPMEMQVFVREHMNYWYSLKSYYMAKTVADMPFQIVFPAIFCVIIYFMTGQPFVTDRFVMFYVISVLTSLVSQSLGMLIGAASPQVEVATFMGPVACVPLLLFAGFFIKDEMVPVYLKWCSYGSFVRYAFEGSLISIYGPDFSGEDRAKIACDAPNADNPKLIMSQFDAKGENFGWDCAMLIIFFLVLRLIAYLALKVKVSQIRFFFFYIFNKLSLHNDNLLTHTRYFFQQLKHEGFRAAFGCNKSRSSCCC